MLLPHGNIVYVLGLTWIDAEGRSPVQQLREYVGKGAHYQVMGSRRTGQRIGYTTDPMTIAGKKRAPRAYSLAAVLQARGQDGIYFLEAEGHAWYAVIDGGQLAGAQGEKVMAVKQAVAAVSQLQATLGLPVFGGLDHFPGARPFSLSELDGMKHKLKPMQALPEKDSASALGLVLLLAGLGGAGYAGYNMVIPSKPKLSPAQQAAQARKAYAQSMLATLPALDNDPAWIVNAHVRADDAFPDLVHGWSLASVTCSPAQCGATYEATRDRSYYSLQQLRERFQGLQVQPIKGKHEALVIVPRTINQVEWTADWVLDPTPPQSSLIDAHGLMAVRLPQVKVDESLQRGSLSQGKVPPGVAGLVREAIVTSGEDFYPAATFGRMAEVLGPLGFTPEVVERRFANSRRGASWRVTWVRISRDEE